MFLGHFGLAFAAKKVAPRVSLGTTIFAAEFLDALWPVLVLTGIETVEIAPGITRVTPLDFVHYPWSHSLLMALLWGVLFAATYWLLKRDRQGALWLGALVVSHWVLDWVVHRPDLPLYPGDANRHGLGVWNSLPASVVIELAMLAAGIAIYLRATRARDRIGTYALWALAAFLVVAYGAAVFGPAPPSAQAVAASALAAYLMMAWGWWVDRHRDAKGTP
jgi:membrane-bound metal-dependent hydrolase YbcI (DUF457 family)